MVVGDAWLQNHPLEHQTTVMDAFIRTWSFQGTPAAAQKKRTTYCMLCNIPIFIIPVIGSKMHFMGTKHVLPQMIDGGNIIITSSVSGINGSPNISAYITSKHAVAGINHAIGVEAALRKIREYGSSITG